MLKRNVWNKIRIPLAGLVFFFAASSYAVTTFAGTASLTWDPPATNTDGTPITDLSGYKLYYGTESRTYGVAIDVGNVTAFLVNNLTDGRSYYFAVTAYDSNSHESNYSNETIKTLPSKSTYLLTPSAGTGGAISPASAVTVSYGSSQTFTIKPNTGYHITTVLIDGVSIGRVSTYTFTNVTANHVIAANFAINTYTITAGTSPTGGTISPSGKIKVSYGGDASFTLTPSAGYHVADVLVDKKSVGPVTSYTFSNIMSSHTITASFK